MAVANLCKQCRGVFEGRRFPESRLFEVEGWPHHATAESMQRAAEQDCLICEPMWRRHFERSLATGRPKTGTDVSSLSFTQYALSHQVDDRLRNDKIEGGVALTFRLEWGPDRDESGVKISRTSMTVATLFPVHDIREPYLASTKFDPVCGDGIAAIKMWMKNCVNDHTACHRGPSDYHPTRLIQIPALDLDHVRLCVTAEEETQGPYATLSHCWGSAMPVRLLRANMRDMTEQIDINTLPKTFQDAIATIRKLGIYYIWIDSLCIIQDSREDWEREALTMSQVYRNALCCLAATEASDCTKGLFLSEPRQPPIHQITTNWIGVPNDTHVLVIESPLRSITDAPLNQRAWVFQERLLSPRILHFTNGQIFWECRETVACGSMPAGLPKLYQSTLTASHGRRLASLLDAELDGDRRTVSDGITDLEYVTVLWPGTVIEYSRGRLTRCDDRLIAISGVAKLLGSHLETQYVAGLWKLGLELQLLWRTNRPQIVRPHDRGPSWSWASLDMEVQYPGVVSPPLGMMACMTNVYTESLTADPFGQIKKGSLTLQGCIYPVHRSNILEKKRAPYREWASEDLTSDHHAFDCQMSWDTVENERVFMEGRMVFWVPIAMFPDRSLAGLLVKQGEVGADTHYCRVGHFEIWDSGHRLDDMAEGARDEESVYFREAIRIC